MGKRRMIKWLIIIAVALIVSIVKMIKASAEAMPTAEASPSPYLGLPDWASDGFEVVTEPPVQSTESPLLGDSSTRSYVQPVDDYWTTYYNMYKAYLPNPSNTNIYQYMNPSGSNFLDTIPFTPWISDNHPHLTNTDTFTFEYSAPGSLNTYAFDARSGGYAFVFLDMPPANSTLTGAFEITYSFTRQFSFTFPSWHSGEYEMAGIDYSTLYEVPVYIRADLYGDNGSVYTVTSEKVTIQDFYSSYDFTIDLGEYFPRDESGKISKIVVSINCGGAYCGDWLYTDLMRQYYLANFDDSNDYYSISWSAKNPWVVGRSFQFNKTEDDRSWLARMFIPSADQINDMLIGLQTQWDMDNNSYNFVQNLRSVLFSFTQSTPQDAIITMPEIWIGGDLLGDGATYGDQYILDSQNINLSQIFNSEYAGYGKIGTWVKFGTSVLIVSAFLNSVFLMVCEVTGLNLWQGVKSDKGGDITE